MIPRAYARAVSWKISRPTPTWRSVLYMILLSSRRVSPDLECLKACFSTRCFDHLGEIQSDLRQADRSYIIAAASPSEGTHLHLAFIGNLLIDRKKATRDAQRRVT